MSVMTENTARKFGAAATEQATNLLENTYSTATEGIGRYNLKMLGIAQANADAAFDYARQFLAVKSPSEMMELCTAFFRKQFEVLTQQAQELAAIGQKVATESAAPLTSGVTKTLKKVA
jgi:phasin